MLSRYEVFTASIFRIYRDIQRLQREEMEKYGLHGALAHYLTILMRFPEGVTAAQLGEICDKDKAAVSRAVAEMERQGLLERKTSGESAYRARLCLTAQGRAAAEYVAQRAQWAVETAGGALTDEERTTLYAALAQVADRLQAIRLPDRNDK